MSASVLLVLAASLGTVVVLMTVTALISRRVGRVAVVDVAWGLGFVLVALVSAVLGDEPVRWLLLAMVAVWGLRLAWHIGRRQVGQTEDDPRYTKMLAGGGFSVAVRRVFLVQGLAIWFVSLPVQVASVTGTRWQWLVWVGVAVWAARSGLRVGRGRPAGGVQEGPGTETRHGPGPLGAGRGTRTISATPACGGASGWWAVSPAACCRPSPSCRRSR